MAFWNRKEERGEGVTADVLFASMKKDRISAEDAMNIPAAARCVNMIASAVASLPVRLYEKTDNDIREIKDDPRVELLNNRTGDTINASEMRIRWVMDYLLLGNAYAYIDRDIYNRVRRIVYISPSAISIRANRKDPINKIFSYTVNGREIYPYQMVKLLRHTDGYGKGIGIIHENAVILSVAYNTMNFEKNMVKKGGNKRGFLKSQKSLSRDAMTSLRENWNKLYTSDGDSCLILNDGMDFKEASNTSVEMQLNENKKLNGGDIMTLFGTADGILSDETVKNAVMPVLDAFEAAFDADLLDEAEKKTRYFAFDTRELTRGNIQQRYNAYAVALQNNFMQLDEIRKEEDLPPLGINFIRLGLNDVLLNPETNMVYTPNTNSWANMGAQSVGDGGADASYEEERAKNPDFEKLYQRNKRGEFTNKYGESGLTSEDIHDKIIEEFKKTNFQGNINYPPKEIDIDSLTFDYEHINNKRHHNITLDKAKEYIKEARISVSRKKPDGEFENYYGNNGAVYVNVNAGKIRTAFHSSEFNNGTIRILETVDKCERRD